MSKKITNKKIVSFDIDGVLNSYPKCFVNYVNTLKKKKFKSINLIKKEIGVKNYEIIKDKYRRSNYKYNLYIDPKMIEIMNKISTRYSVQIVSSRPFNRYKNMRRRTFTWLKKNNIKDFKLYAKKKKIINRYKVILHIDDQEEDINKIYNNKTQFFLLTKNIKKKKRNIVFVKKNKLINTLKKYLNL